MFSLIALALAGCLLLVTMRGFASAGGPTTIHVVDRAVSDTIVDIGKKGDSLGDQLAFGNPLYDAANQRQIGRDQGNCVRTVVGKAWECYWTVLLPGGQITVEGPYYDNGSDSMLAITGGTGVYRDVRGQMRLHAR